MSGHWLPTGQAPQTGFGKPPCKGSGTRPPGGAGRSRVGSQPMSVADLLAEHGSPLWLANLDVVRDRQRAFAGAWRAEWPDVEIAYSHKANRLPAILRALAEKGIGHQVALRGRVLPGALGRRRRRALDRRAGPGEAAGAARARGRRRRARRRRHAWPSCAGSPRPASRRVGVRVCLPGVGHGTSHFGVPMAEVSMAPRHAAALGLRIEALAVHLVSAGFDRPMAEIPRLASALVVKWPQPPERFAAAAKMLAGLAVRMGVPVIDVGGGFPPAPQESPYARAVAGAIGGAGFEGRVLVEPGRALVADAVDLAATVTAVKRLPDRRRCIVLDAGTNLLPGDALRVADDRGARRARSGRRRRRSSPARCAATSTSCTRRPTCRRVSEGDAVVVRGVGAYQQTQSTQFGDLRPAVVARDDGHWRLVSRRETVEDLHRHRPRRRRPARPRASRVARRRSAGIVLYRVGDRRARGAARRIPAARSGPRRTSARGRSPRASTSPTRTRWRARCASSRRRPARRWTPQELVELGAVRAEGRQGGDRVGGRAATSTPRRCAATASRWSGRRARAAGRSSRRSTAPSGSRSTRRGRSSCRRRSSCSTGWPSV